MKSANVQELWTDSTDAVKCDSDGVRGQFSWTDKKSLSE